VDVRDNLFTPVNLDALSGATVIWTWRGSDQHNVTFEDGQSPSANKSSGTHQRTFSTAGTFRYHCTLHSTNFTSGMVGEVRVQ
jgi:plastocyanin